MTARDIRGTEVPVTGVGQADVKRAAAFRERIGVPGLIDVHTHFMP